jgi:hypothetical protein
MASLTIENVTKNWVWLALAATLLTSFYVSNLEDEASSDVVAPVKKVAKKIVNSSKPRNSNNHLARAIPMMNHFSIPQRELNKAHKKQLFKVYKSEAPVAQMTTPIIKPATMPDEDFVVPPVPFKYVGKMDDSPKGSVVYLTANDKLYTVAKGEKIDAFWRFDEEFLLSLQLTYLPKNKPQVLIKNMEEQPVKDADYVQE